MLAMYKVNCGTSTALVFLLIWCSVAQIRAGPPQALPPKPPPDPPAWKIPYFVSSPIRAKHEEFLRDVIRILLREGVFFDSHREGPFRWLDPESLSKELEAVNVDLRLGERASSNAKLLQAIQAVIRYSPHPSHPYMLDKLVAGLDPHALAGDWLVSTVNQNGGIYYTAPAFELVEPEVVRRLGVLFGWTAVDGITTTGAGTANALAVNLALQGMFLGLKTKGLTGVGCPKAVLFVSEHGSRAFEKAALYQGLAANWVTKVSVDPDTGRMSVQHLRKRILAAKREGFIPFMVVGTAGTDDLGAIDDLGGIATVCKEFGIWFHVDATKGGALIFHPKLRSRLNGIERANSVAFGTWMLATPYVTSMIVVQSAGKLLDAFGTHAQVLFDRGSELYNTSRYDTGDATVQSSRRTEIVKLWYVWKARGTKGMAKLVKTLLENSDHFMGLLRMRAGFVPVIGYADLPQVAFYYVPRRWRKSKQDALLLDKVSTITAAVRLELLKQNLMQISTARLSIGGRPLPEFFIASLTNPGLRSADFSYILDLIRDVAEFKSRHTNRQYTDSIKIPALVQTDQKQASYFKQAFNLFIDKAIFFHRRDSPFEFIKPEKLQQLLNLNETLVGANHAELLQDFEKVIKYSPHRGHPYFMYQLQGGMDPYTLAADWVASAMNTPMLTYEDSPVFTLMEQSALAAMRRRIFGSSKGDGIIADGGSMANQMAIALALHAKDGRVRDTGLGVAGGKKFVGFMSEEAHYSTQKGFILQNLGFENIVLVDSNELGQMRPEKLEKAIKRTLKQGNVPFFVCITTGTTVFGAIDPIEPIVALCVKYELWCHVDGMVGGLLAFSDDHVGKLAGLQHVDSFGTDLHKMTGSMMTIAVLITKKENVFKETFGLRAASTSTSISLYNRTEWDLGQYHCQLDKRNNVFKLWMLWKAKGRLGFEGHMNLVMDNAAYMTQQLHSRGADGFLPMLPKFDMTNICFCYAPKAIRSFANQNQTEFLEQLSQVSLGLEKTLTLKGVMGIVPQRRFEDSQPAFLKFNLMDSSITKEDVDYWLDAVAYWGEHLDS